VGEVTVMVAARTRVPPLASAPEALTLYVPAGVDWGTPTVAVKAPALLAVAVVSVLFPRATATGALAAYPLPDAVNDPPAATTDCESWSWHCPGG
jgi:hypothetical protein